MANATFIKMVTPVGKALFSKVNSTFDEYKGKRKYMISLELDPASEKKLMADITAIYEDAQKSPEYKGKEWRARPRLGWKTNKETKKTVFTFWTYAFDKDEKQKTVSVFTKFGQAINDKVIGNGSDIQVSFTPAVYYESEDGNGVSLYLNQILVHNLIEFGGSGGSDFEFEAFELPDESVVNTEEIPF